MPTKRGLHDVFVKEAVPERSSCTYTYCPAGLRTRRSLVVGQRPRRLHLGNSRRVLHRTAHNTTDSCVFRKRSSAR